MSQYRPLAAVVLAAGAGTRMRSGTPKVLHPLCGRPMVLHVVDALAELPLQRIVVVVGLCTNRNIVSIWELDLSIIKQRSFNASQESRRRRQS